jgi:phenylpropionate dioxygenase-like ring-hydroxylating dioxygenase large terminal subunit
MHPIIFTHRDTLKNHNYFSTHQHIVDKYFRYAVNICPHRGSILREPGNVFDNLSCGLHGWSWDIDGQSLKEQQSNLIKRSASMGKSGFIFTNFQEPDTKWVHDLAHEDLEYSHSFYRNCPGDWRWQMEMHIDLLHVPYIHPTLNSYVDLSSIKTEAGTNYIAQYHNHGWWLFVYPGYHIEYEPGKLYFSELIPNENGIGYQIFGHYLFDQKLPLSERNNFCKVNEITLDEDIVAVANIKTEYVKPKATNHPLEKYNMHWFDYYRKHYARKK